jgi:hypothetical protein
MKPLLETLARSMEALRTHEQRDTDDMTAADQKPPS